VVVDQAAAVLRARLPPQDEPIRLLDVGCVRGIASPWDGLRPVTDYVGCDPLVEDCDRRWPAADGFARLRRLGVAVAANEGTATLHVAADPDRSSLLRPNWPVVSRYSDAWRFACQEEREVRCTTLTALARQHGQPDVIRLDSQGLEYPLISSGLEVIGDALCLEVEAGLVERYAGEYPYALVDPLLRQAGLAPVEFVVQHSRRRAWSAPDGRHQPLWCEVTWLRDVVGRRERPAPIQAGKLLLICRALGQLAFGHELAAYLAEIGVIGPAVGALLAEPAAWRRPWRLGDRELGADVALPARPDDGG
jgi:FkbM family methyltransferase